MTILLPQVLQDIVALQHIKIWKPAHTWALQNSKKSKDTSPFWKILDFIPLFARTVFKTQNKSAELHIC